MSLKVTMATYGPRILFNPHLEFLDENDELKMKLDQQCAENSNLKQRTTIK